MGLSDFQEHRKLRKIFFSYPVTLALALLVLWSSWKVVQAWEAHKALTDEVVALEERIQAVRTTRVLLEAKSQALYSPEGIDKEARERFNLKKPGEEVVIFVDEEYRPVTVIESRGWYASLKKFISTLLTFIYE